MKFLDNFKLADEKEDFSVVNEKIKNEIDFSGTNLWILIFAILIASLGLNVNSTAVVIGAMLVSPLMGPIIGLGFGMAINDLALLKKSFFTYLFTAGVSLVASTVYFLISPINDAHSEILARTSPNIYDVLIALCGGFAGILAVLSKHKGNVIPGVAIATALIPPLCTAGYGLATLHFSFFFGALYLFLINSVFIALATLITTRFMKVPFKHSPEMGDAVKAKRIVWVVVIVTLLPSIYFGYDIIQQNQFEENADFFIANEAVFPNDYLLKKEIDAKNRSITLTYGGEIIEQAEISKLTGNLPKYHLENVTLNVQQGFAYLNGDKMDEKANKINAALSIKEKKIQFLQNKLDSLISENKVSGQIYRELKTQYPHVQSFLLQEANYQTDTTQQTLLVSIIHSKSKWKSAEKSKIKDWLTVRLNTEQVRVYFE